LAITDTESPMKALLSQLFVALRSRPITLKMISFAMIGAGNASVDFECSRLLTSY